MSNKLKYAVVIGILLIIYLLSITIEIDKSHNTTNPSAKKYTDEINTAPSSQKITKNVKIEDNGSTAHAKETGKHVDINGKLYDCTNYKKLDNDIEILLFKEWGKENIYYNYDLLKPYSYYNEDELTELADGNDALAMYALAVNHAWKSTYDTYPSSQLLFDADNREHKRKEFDYKQAEKARAWFFAAAINNKPTAFSNILNIIQAQILFKEKQKEYNAVDSLHVQALAYKNLAQELYPILSKLYLFDKNVMLVKRDDRFQALTLDDDKRKQVKNVTQRLKKMWKEERLKYNLPLTFDFQLSDEVLSGMEKAERLGMCTADAIASEKH